MITLPFADMLRYKALVFLQIAIFSIALSDCFYVFTEEGTKTILDALHEANTEWSNKKLETLVKIGNALGGVKSKFVTIGATQRIYDKDGNFVKDINIYFKLTYKNFKEPENKVTMDDIAERYFSLMNLAFNLQNVEFKGYMEPTAPGTKSEFHYYSNFLKFNKGPPPKYTITRTTTKEEVTKIVESFKDKSPTVIHKDVDGNMVQEDSVFTEFNTYVYLDKYSSKIPPYGIIRDAILAYSKDMLPGSLNDGKNNHSIHKITEELPKKHKDYRFAIFDMARKAPPCEHFFDLYSKISEVRICLSKK